MEPVICYNSSNQRNNLRNKMSDVIVLNAEKREVTGKKVSTIRAQGLVPATVYQKGKESFNVSVEYQPLVKAYSAAGHGQPIELTVDGKKYLTMVKDVHMDPMKNTLMHIAFHAVDKNRKVEAEIPVHIEGDVPAEAAGNFIVRQNDHVLVKAIPSELPEFFAVDAAKLVEPGDTLTVADIDASKFPEVEILSELDLQLAVVEEPRVVEEEPQEEAVDAADVPAANGSEAPTDAASDSK
jgi:large subunit ribosomal protein L25